MNIFGMIVAVLQFAAALESAWAKDWQRTAIYCSFSIGSAAIAWK